MLDLLLSWDFWAGLLLHNQLWIMFVSSFLSATVLPGNSEVVFLGYATPILLHHPTIFSSELVELLAIAVIGNSLGSITTYWIGRWFPQQAPQSTKAQWVIEKLHRYGAIMLFFSWLPVVGDLFCALAGWLKMSWKTTALFILLGKIVRYLCLLFLLSPFI